MSNQEKNTTTVIVAEQVFNAIAGYMVTRPFSEVSELIDAMRKMPVLSVENAQLILKYQGSEDADMKKSVAKLIEGKKEPVVKAVKGSGE